MMELELIDPQNDRPTRRPILTASLYRIPRDFGPDKGKLTFELVVVWRGRVVASPEGDDVAKLFRRVANAIEAARTI